MDRKKDELNKWACSMLRALAFKSKLHWCGTCHQQTWHKIINHERYGELLMCTHCGSVK